MIIELFDNIYYSLKYRPDDKTLNEPKSQIMEFLSIDGIRPSDKIDFIEDRAGIYLSKK